MKTALCSLFLFISSLSFASLEDTTTTADTTKGKRFEFSFGSSQLFIAEAKEIELHDSNSIILPTSAMLFFVEFRPFKILRIPVFFNLPTESKQFLVDSVLVNERANPTFGTGLQFKIFKLNIDENSTIEWEMGPLVSVILTKRAVYNTRFLFAPIAAGRLRIIKNENFVMYIGTSYSFGIDSWGLIYGTGFLF